MPIYQFECKSCNEEYDELASYDETGKYEEVECPHCGSKDKIKLMTACNYTFTNPVGTDRWNSEAIGHDYRFKHNIPNVKRERERAKQLSKGKNPYDGNPNDLKLGAGIHDPEMRKGLS